MRKASSFFKSLVVILILFLLQVLVTLPQLVLQYIPMLIDTTLSVDTLDTIIGTRLGASVTISQLTNFTYGVLCLLVFGRWYARVFIAPFRGRGSGTHPRGFSFHTIVAILFLAVGLQYTTQFIVTVTATLRPDWLTAYNTLMQDAGYSNASIFLIVYSALLAPIAEELVFRGLIFRYARYALPFWLANIWQALLFGLVHGNFIQGIYAFALGLFLGFVVHRGHGIKYSIPVHILFNIIGLFYSGLIQLTLNLSFTISIACGIALTIFSVWLFYTDFTPAKAGE